MLFYPVFASLQRASNTMQYTLPNFTICLLCKPSAYILFFYDKTFHSLARHPFVSVDRRSV